MPELLPGDIVFFKTTVSDQSDPVFENFSHLAAYVQSWPYGGNQIKPWHHVEVALSSDSLGGFSQATNGVENWATTMSAHATVVPDGQALDVLRPPTEYSALIVGATRALLNSKLTYATRGLLGFAAASQARMFQAGETRDRVRHFALGADAAPQTVMDGQHTCVSAVLAAVRAAGLAPQCPEPPVPATGPGGAGELPLQEPLSQLFDKVQSEPGVETAPWISPDQVTAGYGTAAGLEVPGPIQTTTAYLKAMAHLITTQFANLTADELVQLGQATPPSDERGWLVSPAMLYDALVALGFTRVE
jgi:hypothetical protein